MKKLSLKKQVVSVLDGNKMNKIKGGENDSAIIVRHQKRPNL